MKQFFSNLWSSESAFRAFLGGFGASVIAYPEVFATVPKSVAVGAVILSLLVKAGDKNAETKGTE